MYKRKTRDVYVVQAYYGQVWCDLYSTDSYQDAYSNYLWFAKQEFSCMHRITIRRERIHENNN